MTTEDLALRIGTLSPLKKGLLGLSLALIEADRSALAEELSKLVRVDPDKGGAAIPWELIDDLIAGLQGEELRAWMIAFGRACDANGANLIEALSRLARQRLAH